MADKDWPSWRYGPSGEAQIFQREVDVPKGWVDSPSKLPPAPEKLGGDGHDGGAVVLLSENRALLLEIDNLREENESLRRESVRQTERANYMEETNQRLRGRIHELEQEIAHLRKQIPTGAEPESTARRPRKLSAGTKGTPFTPQDESITLDEGRAERLKVLREAGVTIADDATDGDIEEALDWLEKQVEAQGNREG